ncbi:MAG: Ig-like domain-containing protein [Gemmatimonadaceae bacterium]
MLLTALAFLALQQGPGQQPQTVARLVVTPSQRSIVAGDTLRISARAVDAGGKTVESARVRFFPAGGLMEATVDSMGLISTGATGVIPVAVVAIVPGAKPVIERLEFQIVPGPATRIDVKPEVGKLVVGQRLRLRGESYSRLGDKRKDRLEWKSSSPSIVKVSADGLLEAVGAGSATISVAAGGASATLPLQVVPNTIASVELTPSRSEARQGDVIRFKAVARDRSGAAIAGLKPTWSFSPGQGMIDEDGVFVGYEPSEYLVTASFGTRAADAAVRLAPRDVRRRATVLGRLPRSKFMTGEVWVHPNGKIAYLSTVLGGDRIYVLDISTPSKPVVIDSVMANTRSINDVMTSADGKVLVFTRENAANRVNGIVIATLEDPAHPKPVAEFTEGVTSGVHSAFVYTQPKYGTHVFLTNDGTGGIHIVDINDPSKPKQVAEWRTPRADAGRLLHDIDVQDGLAYLSNWNDGLVILDVGNGVKGGTPSAPKLVTQFKYDLNELYREAESAPGYHAGFIRGTHTAWRHKNYVFIGDEVFPPPTPAGFDFANMRAYGRLQVIDVSNIEKPRSVAWFEPEYGGTHNVWVAGDTLYVGAYNSGFHAFDISGELRGDLKAQGREIAHVMTADMDGFIKNKAMTWGVVVKNDLAYVNDLFNGLWVVKLEPKPPLIP